MLFNSPIFIGFLLITLMVYYLPFLAKQQLPLLVIASLFFYSYNQPYLVLLLLFSVFINIVFSYLIVYGHRNYEYLYGALGVILNLSILIVFKYSGLFLSLITFSNTGILQTLSNLPLPIGISFFTFQGISLIVDVYKSSNSERQIIVPRSFKIHALRIVFFKGFFPQLISGPIVKAKEFLPQIEIKLFKDIDWDIVIRNLILGYFLKMVVADNLKEYTFWIAFPYFRSVASLQLILLIFAYSCQIFADFAGYSLIAIGLARLFGYKFPINFNYPYISTSLKDFWRRWHISLSTFLMQYLYVPLGGNKLGNFRMYLNLMIVMILGGFWHGAAWSYAIWGAVHGFALAGERYLMNSITIIRYTKAIKLIKGIFVFVFVSFAWLLFKLPNIEDVKEFFISCISNGNITLDIQTLIYILIYSSPIFFLHLYYLIKVKLNEIFINFIEPILYSVLLFLIIFNSGSSGEFIYFQF